MKCAHFTEKYVFVPCMDRQFGGANKTIWKISNT